MNSQSESDLTTISDVHSCSSVIDLLSPATVHSQASQPQSPLSNIGNAYADAVVNDCDGDLHDLADVTNIIKTCEAGLVLSVTRILRATLARFRVYVCMYVCM